MKTKVTMGEEKIIKQKTKQLHSLRVSIKTEDTRYQSPQYKTVAINT